MNDPFRHLFMVEVGDLLPQMKILHQRWAPRPRFKRIVVVGNALALIRRQEVAFRHRGLSGVARCDGGFLLMLVCGIHERWAGGNANDRRYSQCKG